MSAAEPQARYRVRTVLDWERLDSIVERAVQRVRRGDDHREWAHALRIVAASIRAGNTLSVALEHVAQRVRGPVGAACDSAAARIRIGCGAPAELARVAASSDSASPARVFALIVALQHRRGGDLSAPADRLASLLHERCSLDAEARSATAQARFTGRAVVALPLVIAATAMWRSPSLMSSVFDVRAVALCSPGLLLIAIGTLVARRASRRALVELEGASVAVTRRHRRSLVASLAGCGPHTKQAARLVTPALGLVVVMLMLRGPSLGLIALGTIMCGCAAAWPWARSAASQRDRADIVGGGIEALLELSIAMLSAGATVHEVASRAVVSIPTPLRDELLPAVHSLRLGQSVASSYGGLDIVAASPHLSGWLQVLTTSSSFGSPSIDALEQVLRDARAQRRERVRQVAATASPRMQLAFVLLVVPGVMYLMLLATVTGLASQLRGAGMM